MMKKETIAKVQISFPTTAENEDLRQLEKICGSIYMLETCFGIEFSCGDGKYLSDFKRPTGEIDENGDLVYEYDEAAIDKYGENLDLSCPPRLLERVHVLRANWPHKFEVKSDGVNLDFYFNEARICSNVTPTYLGFMTTKEVCMTYLAAVEQKIESHDWEVQVDEPSSLLEDKYMEDYCAGFNLPMPAHIGRDSVVLPQGWLPDENRETSADYKEVADEFLRVYNLLKYEASREDEALSMQVEQDLDDLRKDYRRAVL
jgi:hypothetical protein